MAFIECRGCPQRGQALYQTAGSLSRVDFRDRERFELRLQGTLVTAVFLFREQAIYLGRSEPSEPVRDAVPLVSYPGYLIVSVDPLQDAFAPVWLQFDRFDHLAAMGL